MRTIGSVLTEAVGLGTRTAQLWWRLWPQLIALMLLGWVGYNTALMVSAEVAVDHAWAVIPLFSLGLVALLSTTVVGLRLVAGQLGVVEMVRTARQEAGDDDEVEDNSLTKLLILTMLPFLGVYAAFGYVDALANDLVLLTVARSGLGDSLLQKLNPVGSRTAVIVTIVVIVGLYVLRRVVDALYQRTGRRILGLLTTFVESCFLFVILLGGFRLIEQVGLWFSDRKLVGWWDAVVGALASGLAVFRIDLPEVLTRFAELWTQLLWPTLWDTVSQPIAWLAMAALVFGSRVVSVADLWRKGQPLSAQLPGSQHLRITRRLARSSAEATGARRVVLQVQQAFFGDIDDKYLPTWHSLRLMLRAGLVFLGGYIITFALLQIAGMLLGDLLVRLIGGRDGETWALLQPFLDLDDRVLVMSIQVTLLAVAFARALSIFAERASAGDALAPVAPTPVATAPGTPAPTQPVLTRVGIAGLRPQLGALAVVTAACLLLTVVTVALQERDDTRRVAGELGEVTAVAGREITVGEPRFGDELQQEGRSTVQNTPLSYLVVPFTVSCQVCPDTSNAMVAVNGDRRYPAIASSAITPTDGFASSIEAVFEIDPADIGPGLHVEVDEVAGLVGYHDVYVVDLGIEEEHAERVRTDLVGTSVRAVTLVEEVALP